MLLTPMIHLTTPDLYAIRQETSRDRPWNIHEQAASCRLLMVIRADQLLLLEWNVGRWGIGYVLSEIERRSKSN